MTINDSLRPILFFDGVCNLCNGAVQFIIRHDKRQIFLFAPLQSDAGREALAYVKLSQDKSLNSVVLYVSGRYYLRSAAILHTMRLLGGWWLLLYGAMIVPRFMRDAVYGYIARRRYRWFGKKDECMIPTPALKSRFIG